MLNNFSPITKRYYFYIDNLITDSLTELDISGNGKCILMTKNDTTSGYHPTAADCSEENSFICELGKRMLN